MNDANSLQLSTYEIKEFSTAGHMGGNDGQCPANIKEREMSLGTFARWIEAARIQVVLIVPHGLLSTWSLINGNIVCCRK